MDKFSKSLLIVIAIVAIAGILWYWSDQEGLVIKDDIVLRVNSTSFSRSEFANVTRNIAQGFEMQGIDIDKEGILKQAVESFVHQTLLEAYADEKGMTVTQTEIDDSLEEMTLAYGMSNKEELLSFLKEQGAGDVEDINKLLALELKINKLISSYGDEIDVTEKEIKGLYDEYVEYMQNADQEMPAYEEVQVELHNKLLQNKAMPLLLAKLEELEKDAVIEVFISAEEIEV